jgi:hypothetical protein
MTFTPIGLILIRFLCFLFFRIPLSTHLEAYHRFRSSLRCTLQGMTGLCLSAIGQADNQ